MITVVTGIPRSGTSMMMRMLQAGGMNVVWEDIERPEWSNQFNPNGYFEHSRALTATWTKDDLQSWNGKVVKCLDMITNFPDNVDVRAIVMRRDLRHSVASARAIADAAGWAKRDVTQFWQGNLDAIRSWTANRPHIEIWYDDVIRNPANECLRILALLHTKYDRNDVPSLNLAAMVAVVNKDLRHFG